MQIGFGIQAQAGTLAGQALGLPIAFNLTGPTGILEHGRIQGIDDMDAQGIAGTGVFHANLVLDEFTGNRVFRPGLADRQVGDDVDRGLVTGDIVAQVRIHARSRFGPGDIEQVTTGTGMHDGAVIHPRPALHAQIDQDRQIGIRALHDMALDQGLFGPAGQAAIAAILRQQHFAGSTQVLQHARTGRHRGRQAVTMLQRAVAPLACIQFQAAVLCRHVDPRTQGIDGQIPGLIRIDTGPGTGGRKAAIDQARELGKTLCRQHQYLGVARGHDHVACAQQGWIDGIVGANINGADHALILQLAGADIDLEPPQGLLVGQGTRSQCVQVATIGGQGHALQIANHVAGIAKGTQAILDALDEDQLSGFRIAAECRDGALTDVGRHGGHVHEATIAGSQ